MTYVLNGGDDQACSRIAQHFNDLSSLFVLLLPFLERYFLLHPATYRLSPLVSSFPLPSLLYLDPIDQPTASPTSSSPNPNSRYAPRSTNAPSASPTSSGPIQTTCPSLPSWPLCPSTSSSAFTPRVPLLAKSSKRRSIRWGEIRGCGAGSRAMRNWWHQRGITSIIERRSRRIWGTRGRFS
jgi:hypothetical protein